MPSVVLLAFSYNSEDPLPAVKVELDRIVKILDSTPLNVQKHWLVSLEQIETSFRKYQAAIKIFHYAGHAGGQGIEVHDDGFGPPVLLFSEGLATVTGLLGKLGLVFLNGCSTRDQVDFFIANGAGAVIATNRALPDKIALNFANRFYTNFCDTNARISLQKSFVAANGSIWSSHADDLKARGFGSPATTGQLYDLHINPTTPEVRDVLFADWINEDHSVAASAPIPVSSGKTPLKSDLYLLCDRYDQNDRFLSIVNEKANGRKPEPVFFFIHDKMDAMPVDLRDRFVQYSPVDVCTPHKEDIKLIGVKSYLDDGDKYKEMLHELYVKTLGGQYDSTNQSYSFERRPPSEKLLIVNHDLDFRMQHERFSEFLDYYIGDFSKRIQQDISDRVIVIFSLTYLLPGATPWDIFDKLGVKYPERCYVMSQLKDVDAADVLQWQLDYFNDSADILEKVIPPGKDAVPMRMARKPLMDYIAEYNAKSI